MKGIDWAIGIGSAIAAFVLLMLLFSAVHMVHKTSADLRDYQHRREVAKALNEISRSLNIAARILPFADLPQLQKVLRQVGAARKALESEDPKILPTEVVRLKALVAGRASEWSPIVLTIDNLERIVCQPGPKETSKSLPWLQSRPLKL